MDEGGWGVILTQSCTQGKLYSMESCVPLGKDIVYNYTSILTHFTMHLHSACELHWNKDTLLHCSYFGISVCRDKKSKGLSFDFLLLFFKWLFYVLNVRSGMWVLNVLQTVWCSVQRQLKYCLWFDCCSIYSKGDVSWDQKSDEQTALHSAMLNEIKWVKPQTQYHTGLSRLMSRNHLL